MSYNIIRQSRKGLHFVISSKKEVVMHCHMIHTVNGKGKSLAPKLVCNYLAPTHDVRIKKTIRL